MSSYNLTDSQKNLIRWIVQEINNGNLKEEFLVSWLMTSGWSIANYQGNQPQPEISIGALDALANAELILLNSPDNNTRRCTVTAKAYEAVKSDFGTPDISFVKHLTPLSDVTNLDNELKKRCLPSLGAGSTNPHMWDSAIQTAGKILEQRLRAIGGITDDNRVGRNLVNDVLGRNGTLASKFSVDAEREGYRDLYAGAVGVFRNPSAHKFIDPTPEEGGAIIIFINLLLKKLEDLR